MAQLISRDVATGEVNDWLDSLKKSAKKREEFEPAIDSIIDAMCEGQLIIEDNILSVNLKFPVGGEKGQDSVKVLKFTRGVKIETIRVQLQNVKPNDTIGMSLAYLAAVTGQPKLLLKELDTEDYALVSAVLVFFM